MWAIAGVIAHEYAATWPDFRGTGWVIFVLCAFTVIAMLIADILRR